MATHLHVVLTEDLPNVGKSGELVRVRPGYARNFLLPRGLAAVATPDNVRRLEHEKRVASQRAAKVRAQAEDLAGKLAAVKLVIGAQVGAESKLYGSVTSRDVQEALAKQGFEIDRRKIAMDPIKELGVFKVGLHVASGVDATIDVEVVAKE
jgi:large subunit ribosomal protein L9